MKTYEEMAASVLARRNEYQAARKRHARIVAVSLCLALAVGGTALWLNRSQKSVDTVPGQSGIVMSTNAQGGSVVLPVAESSMRPVTENSANTGGTEEQQSGTYLLEGEENPEVPMTQMITYYETDGTGSYSTPKNGDLGLSIPLKEAMKHYGKTDQVQYRIVIDLFADGQQLDPTGDEAVAEIDRLGELGYRTGLERCYQDGVLTGAVLTLHAFYDEIQSLPLSGEYGYMLFLHDERMSSDLPADAVVVAGDPHAPVPVYSQPARPAGNGTGLTVLPYIVQPSDLPDDLRPVYGGQYLDANRVYVLLLTEDSAEHRTEFCDYLGISQENVVFQQVAYSYEYLTDLQTKISAAMAAGELPSVAVSALDDCGNQIVLQFVTPSEQETDPAELALVRSFDTQGGAIEFQYGGAAATFD